MILQSTKENVTFWSGTSAKYERLKADGELIANRIYFVGKSRVQTNGFNDSKEGIIYVATSASTAVRFGSFSKYDDIDEIINQINQKLDTKTETKEYPTFSQFPESGLPNTLYIDTSTGATYRWDGEQYAVMGGYTAGEGIEIEGNVISNTHTLITTEEIDSICV